MLAALAAVPAALPRASAAHHEKPTLCLFSKHAQFLDYPALGKTLKQMGIAGCDLTVRPGGHVEPENVKRDLPRAAEALKAAGIALPMITTGLTNVFDPAARPTLYTAGEQGVDFFKVGYYRLRGEAMEKLDRTLESVKRDVDGLVGLAQHAKVQGGFHNHSGAYVGAALWDHYSILEDMDERWIGYYFDPCHATIEGGKSGWEIGFHRLKHNIKMVAIKDFYWEKRGGEWKTVMCPLGEGMVNFPKFFALLRESGFTGPISMHMEYAVEADTESARQEKELAVIEKDYRYLEKVVGEAWA